ncbi:MAG TPA: helix-turn-helix domain-containing protein [Pirellulales bacterium]|nr:helix-turn-helix domain-containing protein [Pirellulales bacterium]
MSSLIQLNRLFAFDDLVAKYGGPRSLWEKLQPSLPVFCTIDGSRLYLETEIDEFLKTARDRLQLNSIGNTTPSLGSVVPEEGKPEFVSVAEAQRRYLGGMRSRRWWYRMAETGKIAHHRVGESILFRAEDIENFIAKSRNERADTRDVQPLPAPSIPVPAPTPVRPPLRRKPDDTASSFRFFPRR